MEYGSSDRNLVLEVLVKKQVRGDNMSTLDQKGSMRWNDAGLGGLNNF